MQTYLEGLEPPPVLRDKRHEEVAEHDRVRQEEMAKAQMPQQLMAGVTAAKTLSETEIGGNSALAALTGAPIQ